MTDDTCGWPTTTDGECQNPAGEDGTCWIPSHGDADAENPHGREFTIAESDHETLLESARAGMSKAGCARSVGVDEKSLQRYVDAHPDFRRAFTQARAEGERKLIEGPLYETPDGEPDMDGQHARFLLSSSFDYVKTERQELENTGDEPLSDVTINFDDVDT